MELLSEFPELDGLRLIPLDRLLLHEDHDAKRLARLRDDIESDGVQANPVIASPAHDSYFLVLDGAHRVHALELAGCNFALVQVVSPPDVAEGWQHSLCTGIEGWEEISSNLEGVSLREENGLPGSLGVSRPVARLRTPDGRALLAEPLEANIASRVEALWALRGIYPAASLVTRVEPGDDAMLEGCVLVHYAEFPLPEILATVSLGAVLPAGVTRFSVSRRVLGVKFPLDTLRSNDLESASASLRKNVESHLEENRIRRYDEPILLFE